MSDCHKPSTAAYWLRLAFAALAIRLAVAFLLFGGLPQVSDALSYANQARRMVEGTQSQAAYYWPPGRSYGLTPFFLLFGTSEAVVKANSVLFDVGCVLLIALLAHRLLRQQSAARIAGWIAAFYPPAVLLSPWSYAQNVAQFFLLASACVAIGAMQRPWKGNLTQLARWLVAGAFLGFAILTRPSVTSVLLVVVGGLCFAIAQRVRSRRTQAATPWLKSIGGVASFAFGAFLCVLPVAYRHASLGAGWCVSTNNELNFFLGNNRYTPNYKTWHWGQHHPSGPGEAEVAAYFSRVTQGPQRRQRMLHEGLQYIAERPDVFLLRTVNRIRAYWGFDYLTASDLDAPAWIRAACLAIEAGGYILTMLLVIAGVFLYARGMEAKNAVLLIALVAALQLPYALSFACGRYHFPDMGFLIPFAGLAIDVLRRKEAGRWHVRWYWTSVAIFLAIQVEYAWQIYSWHTG